MKKGKAEAPGRRAFSAEFKLEAVQLMQAQRAQGVSLSEIGRQIGVRPDQLRSWARRLAKHAGVPPSMSFRAMASCRPRRRTCAACSARSRSFAKSATS